MWLIVGIDACASHRLLNFPAYHTRSQTSPVGRGKTRELTILMMYTVYHNVYYVEGVCAQVA